MRDHNDELIRSEGQILVRDAINNFKQATTSDKLPLPSDAAELNYHLEHEKNYCTNMFTNAMQDYDANIVDPIRDELEVTTRNQLQIAGKTSFIYDIDGPIRRANSSWFGKSGTRKTYGRSCEKSPCR